MKPVYKQKYYHSCLVVSLLMAANLGQDLEEKIYFNGEDRKYFCYIDSMLATFLKLTGKNIECIVDSKYLAENFKKSLAKFNDEIAIKAEAVTAERVLQLVAVRPVVVHLDDNYLGDYSHCSHFVLVNSLRKDGRLEILDPWDGKRKFLTAEQLDRAFLSLKNHIKMSPEIIFIK